MASIRIEDYISTDNMLQKCEGVTIYDGIPNIESVVKYRKGDILISNIRPYLQKIWIADRDGGCSPDVLVIRVDDANAYLPQYVYQSLKRVKFFDHMMAAATGAKMPRGNKTHTLRFVIPDIPITQQQSILSTISTYESKIAEARAIMDTCASRKQAILDKYLK